MYIILNLLHVGIYSRVLNFIFRKQAELVNLLEHIQVLHAVAVVTMLWYKSEGRWFDPSWCQWIFH